MCYWKLKRIIQDIEKSELVKRIKWNNVMPLTVSLLYASNELLNVKSFEVKSYVTEKSCGLHVEFQALAINC